MGATPHSIYDYSGASKCLLACEPKISLERYRTHPIHQCLAIWQEISHWCYNTNSGIRTYGLLYKGRPMLHTYLQGYTFWTRLEGGVRGLRSLTWSHHWWGRSTATIQQARGSMKDRYPICVQLYIPIVFVNRTLSYERDRVFKKDFQNFTGFTVTNEQTK